jgi:hypothetical protein
MYVPKNDLGYNRTYTIFVHPFSISFSLVEIPF